MSDWSSAFTHALRSLRRQPTFTLIALATLALGIGANTAIFSVIKTVVLNPLPYPDPERIVVVWEVSPEGNQDRVSIPTFEDWRTEARSLGSLAAYRHVDFSFSGRGDPQNVPGVRATPELFTVLRANAMLGRAFTRDEAVVGSAGLGGCSLDQTARDGELADLDRREEQRIVGRHGWLSAKTRGRRAPRAPSQVLRLPSWRCMERASSGRGSPPTSCARTCRRGPAHSRPPGEG